MRFTKRFIACSVDHLSLSKLIRYERYYIHNQLRIQKKADRLEKEILDSFNDIIQKQIISEEEFDILKERAYAKIIRDSYLYLRDERVSLKKYLADYEGLMRVEVKFKDVDEMKAYQKEPWMGKDITDTPLAFDKDLSKLSKDEFLKELQKYK